MGFLGVLAWVGHLPTLFSTANDNFSSRLRQVPMMVCKGQFEAERVGVVGESRSKLMELQAKPAPARLGSNCEASSLGSVVGFLHTKCSQR